MSYGLALALAAALASQIGLIIHYYAVLRCKNEDINQLFDIYLAANALHRVETDMDDEDIACVDEWGYMRLKQVTSKFQQELERRG
jgi:predicted DNA-binding protein